MSASYNDHTFFERGESGRAIPGWDKKIIVVTKIIPGGNPVVQAIAADVQRLAMPIRCTASELADLYDDANGDTHTLDSSLGLDSALLEAIDTPTEVLPGNDMYFTVLHFIRS